MTAMTEMLLQDILDELRQIKTRLPAEGQGPLTGGEFNRIKTQADEELQAALKDSEEADRG